MMIENENTLFESFLTFVLKLFGITDDTREEEETLIQRFIVRLFFLLSGAYSDAYKEVELSEKERYRRMDIVTKSVYTRKLRMKNALCSETAPLRRSPSRCSICLEDYTEEDVICWSPNAKCDHIFHKCCIIEWLLENDQCPLCRCQYMGRTVKSTCLK